MVGVHHGNGFYDIFAGEAYHYDEDGVTCIVPETFAAIKDGSVIACGKMATITNGCLTVNSSSTAFDPSIPAMLARSVKFHSPLHAKANGRQVINVPLTLFNDDTSGNVSKKWNKFESWLFTLAGLPFKATQQQENINFICTAKDASAIETAEIIVHCMRELRDDIIVYDTTLKQEVLVIGKMMNWRKLLMQDRISPAAVTEQMKLAGIKDYNFNKFLVNYFSSPAMNPLLGNDEENPFIMGPLDTPVEILH
ncbi:hypothetical protein HDU77_009681 [Chytriomyces hyalinus]|nr:hypothetical protein HDU77_009681 [Chytriomyces hyalinus]